MKNYTIPFICLSLLLFSLQWPLPALDQKVKTIVEVDWQRGVLVMECSSELDPQISNLSRARFLAEQQIQLQLPTVFLDSLFPVTLNSFYSVGEYVKENTKAALSLGEAVQVNNKTYTHLSTDLREVVVRYDFPFFGESGIILPLLTHTSSFPMERYLGYVPVRDFQGLVIYARGSYPSYGKEGEEKVKPALFFRIFDEELNLVLEREMCDPRSLKKWGMAAYSYSLDETPFLPRIGPNPLRTMARGVFGKNGTDIIIPNKTARQLLAEESNHRLLREGRILIIIDQP